MLRGAFALSGREESFSGAGDTHMCLRSVLQGWFFNTSQVFLLQKRNNLGKTVSKMKLCLAPRKFSSDFHVVSYSS